MLARRSANFNYLAPITQLIPPEPPFRYAHAPPKGRPLHNELLDRHSCQLYDIRENRESIGLDKSGFDFLTRTSTSFTDWGDTERIVEDYYAETIKQVLDRLGASRVHIFDHTIRKRVPEKDSEEDKLGKRQPVYRVHVDQTPLAGRNRFLSLFGEEAGTEALKKTAMIINVWRPLRGPVVDAPVGMIDTRSVDWEKDMAIAKILYRDRTGYTYLVHHNPAHKWYYLSNMMPDEVLLIKCYDNENPRVIAAHSGFVFDTPPEGFQPRHSIELRALVVI